MSVPLKPWEHPDNLASLQGSTLMNNQAGRLHSSIAHPSTGGGSVGESPGPPSLPPRPGQTRPIYSSSMYGRSMYPYNSSYSSPLYSSMGSYSPYSSPYSMGYGAGGYGGYYGRNMYGMSGVGAPFSDDGHASFSQLAEETSAGAFESIESFVNAFGSISAMLESTFHALYSSFRAVVGVADHMGRLKHILSAMAIFRFFRWVIRRFLFLVGISKIKPEDVEGLWDTIVGHVDSGDSRPEWEKELYPRSTGSSWPIIVFVGFVLAGPYFMWKLLRSLNPNKRSNEDKAWAVGKGEHFEAVAAYDFEGMADRELKMKSGQRILLAPAACQPPNVKGWVLASDGVKIGLVPTNYIKILGKRSGKLNESQHYGSNRSGRQSLKTIPENSVLPQSNDCQIEINNLETSSVAST